MPQSARLSAGGGCNCYLGNAQIEVGTYWKGLPLLPRINNSLTIPYCQHGLTIQKSELHCNEENFTFDTELYFQPWINLKKSCVFCVHFWFFGEHCPELSKLFKAIFIFAEIKCWQKDQIEVYLEAVYNESQSCYNGNFFSGRLWLINSIITDETFTLSVMQTEHFDPPLTNYQRNAQGQPMVAWYNKKENES